MQTDLLAKILCWLRIADEGLPSWAYRDILLGAVFVPSVLIFTVLLVNVSFGLMTVLLGAVAGITLALARAKRMLLAATLLVAGLRFFLAFLFTQRLTALMAGVGCAFVVWALAHTASSYEDK